ncbi:hypothetical protein Cni_G18079 [Canna indica]|uniref:Uncharacterized protein n=1 Tax=Canna indica TaxID=4628 RepID=A0AAQ3KNU5_9LILI|nr:hypothetical protein Cni_G18079 [Canna indica]
MIWSPQNAANAYLDALKLRSQHQNAAPSSSASAEPESNEFISALAAGIDAKLIVEVSPEASHSTVALAAAARTTGGRLVCILPEAGSLAASERVVRHSGLRDMVEFKIGDPHRLLPELENVDFSLVDCKNESYKDLLKLLDVNPARSVVVASHLEGGKEGLCGDCPGLKRMGRVRSMKNLMGEGMEVTTIIGDDELGRRHRRSFSDEEVIKKMMRRNGRPHRKSKWVKKVDEESGEEHIFRVPNC